VENSETTEIIDNERLRWIAFFHYVSGGITIALSFLFLIYVIIFGLIAANPDVAHKAQIEDPEQFLGVMRIVVTVFASLFALGLVYGICEIVSGAFIKRRKYRIFSMVIAVPRILNIPYGTILSIITLMMLSRTTVKEQYENAKDIRRAVQGLDA